MGLIEKWNSFAKKNIYINGSHQITAGRLILVMAVTFFQFLGIWCTNDWAVTPAMFFLLANMFFALGKREDETTDTG